MSSSRYDNYTREQLLARIASLESLLPPSRTSSPPSRSKPKAREDKPFSFDNYSRRKIALKFCYSGWEYNGLAFQNHRTPLPTVEETLHDALVATRLIDPAGGPEGCGWERCGRTDRGVSGAGQVVSLWVRSNLPKVPDASQKPIDDPVETALTGGGHHSTEPAEVIADGLDLPLLEDEPFSEHRAELGASLTGPTQITEMRYLSILNRVLPPTIRILAWSPVLPTFSSRFNTRYRHYKYFFSPAGLDVEAMRDAAQRLVGEHDFRNLCKLDPSKQITSFKRKILRADISPVDASRERSHLERQALPRPMQGIYVFDLIGTAFLYNQVRHIMAILFLVGAGLEHPSVITALVNTDASNPYPPYREGEPVPPIVDRKPEYQMADSLPLVLWDCAYNEDDVQWQTDESGLEESGPAHASDSSVMHHLLSTHTRSMIHSTLDAHFLLAGSRHHPDPPQPFPLSHPDTQPAPSRSLASLQPASILHIPLGGGTYRRAAARAYVPLLQRTRLNPVEVTNERWRIGKGRRRMAKGDRAAVVDEE